LKKEHFSAPDLILTGMQALDKAINKLSNDFNTELPKIKKKTDRMKLKTTLCQYINKEKKINSYLKQLKKLGWKPPEDVLCFNLSIFIFVNRIANSYQC